MMDLLGVLVKEGKFCTGCGACHNVCPFEAISMEEDADGFLYPHIKDGFCKDCGLCERTCPVLHTAYINEKNPACYAMMASDEERAGSSSGGFVPVVSKWVISQGGLVYGAAWTEDWRVHHIAVDNETDLPKIQSSKYLQSETELVYRDVKKNLQNGKWVLFTGMPCQVAGLYAYLGNMMEERLLTIDILCHGTPSYRVFRKYLDENYDVKNIYRYDFRDKSYFGWSTCANVYYKDGRIERRNEREDSYYKAFLPCMSMRPSCANCQMSCLPRQGDFTAGDFWGIGRYNPRFNDRKGTSMILVNNERAANLVENFREAMKLWENVPIEYATHINKTILHPFRSHAGRKHFFSSLDKKPFNELVEKSLVHHYDIGIVGLWYGINYGSVLTYFALYALLRDMGYDPVMLPKPNILWEERFNDPGSIAQRFIWRHCNVFVPCRVQEEYPRFNDFCDDFVVGSDVVWNYDICGRQADMFFFLDWVEHGHKKIAFAASFGNGLVGEANYVNKAVHCLNKFDYLSCRESFGAEAARKQCGREDIQHVMDPVFLCNPEIYMSAIREATIDRSETVVFAYILSRRTVPKDKMTLLDAVCEHYHAQLKICGNPNAMRVFQEYFGDMMLPELSVEEWLAYIQNCEMYIGDSYHGLCFSLIFHRPFIVIYENAGKHASGARFYSLLKLIGLENRIIDRLEDIDQINKLIQTPIDWDDVERRLAPIRDFSKKWFKEALLKEKTVPTGAEKMEDEFKRKINEYGVRVFEQGQRLEQLSKTVEEQKARLSFYEKKMGSIARMSSYEHAAAVAAKHARGRKIVLYGDDEKMRQALDSMDLKVDKVVTGIREKTTGGVEFLYDLRNRANEFYIVVPFLEYEKVHVERLQKLGFREREDYNFVREF